MRERIKVYLYNQTIKEIDMTDFTVITEDVFAYHDEVVKVVLPEGVQRIGANAFEHCTRLQEVICPSTLTNIESEAFRDCVSLVKVECGKNVNIDATAFRGCHNYIQ